MPGRKRARRKEGSPPVDTSADAAAETTAAAAAVEERVAGGSRAGSTQEVSAEAALEALERQWPQRRAQARALVAALGRSGTEGASAAALLVYGGAGTGKTAVVRDTLRTLNRPHAYASCLTCTTPGLLFEALLAGLRGWGRSAEEAAVVAAKERRCDRLADLVEGVARWAPADSRTCYLLVDDAERLRDKGAGGDAASKESALPVLARLPELARVNVCVVLISRLGPEMFAGNTGHVPPMPLFFSAYDDAALHGVLVAQRPAAACATKYGAFVQPLLATFGRSCRNLHELRTLCAALWPKYLEPEVKEGKALEPRKLWSALMAANAEVRLGGSGLTAVGNARRGVVPAMVVPLSKEAIALATRRDDGASAGPVAATDRLDFELSYLSKMLLLAAYVAARTPTALDKHVFKHGRGDEATGKRRKASVMQMDRRTEQAKARALAGPVGFTLERLLAIMQTLVRDAALDAVGDSAARDEQLSADVFMQVTSLVALNLLSQHSTDVLDGSPKYFCNVGDELAGRVAQNVRVPLNKYVVYA